LKAIAAEAGVTVAAVSMALRDHPRISAKRRRQIHELADRMGYRPDAKLSELMGYLRKEERPDYAGTLAVLTGYDHPNRWKGMRSIVDTVGGAREQAERLGYRVDTIWAADPELRPERLEAILVERDIHGLILTRMPKNWPDGRFDWSRFSAVRILDAVDQPGIPMVRGNHIEHAHMAAEQIAARGFRRAVLVVSDSSPGMLKQGWRMGFETTLRDAGVEALTLSIAPESGKLNRKVLQRFRPQVVVSVDTLAEFILPHCPGTKPPGFISLNVSIRDRQTSGIVIHHALVGQQCVNMIVAQINRNQPGLRDHDTQVLITGKWQEGETIGQPQSINSSAKPSIQHD